MQLNPLVARGRVIAAGRMLAGLDQEQLAGEQGRRGVRMATLRAVQDALERLGVDVAQNSRTGHHAVGTSYA